MPSFIDKLSNIDRYRQTITIIVSSHLIVLSITSLAGLALLLFGYQRKHHRSGSLYAACNLNHDIIGLYVLRNGLVVR
jgi:hypothetical protein